MWELTDGQCPECSDYGVERFTLTDEGWAEYVVAERHGCGWLKIYDQENRWAIDEDTL